MGRFSTQKARQVQQRLANLVDEHDRFINPPRRICGLDVTYLRQEAIGAAVVLNFPGLQMVEQQTIRCQVPIPYIPTLLSFREFPPMSLAFKALENQPDLCFVDAHGRAHPYKLGAASHFGVLHNIPTIGVAKKILCGIVQTRESKYDEIYLENELVGARVNSKKGYNPLFVSVGHRVSLPTAIKMTQACIRKYKLPEPIRLAHNLATKTRRKLIEGDVVE